MASAEQVLDRVWRNAVIACLAMAVVAWLIARGRLEAPRGVVAGGAIVATSFRGIKAGIDAALGGTVPDEARGRKAARGLVKFFTRYAIMAGAGYLIVVRLQLPPLAVFAGASSLVVAVMMEAVRGVPPRA